TPYGVDCSGLCFNAYRFNGINIWRDADFERSESLRKIDLAEAKKGDLLFFKGHVAMYLGDGEIIHASASAGRVVIENYDDKEGLKEIFICVGTAF
ncbi:MAG: C40 family peptidase, partial [Clostridia bacterium]|nr:C40 family peptidase [Clostridia bacterium]